MKNITDDQRQPLFSPILWLCGISTPFFLISAYKFRDFHTIFLILIITAIVPIGIACIIFFPFLIFFPKKLQSEYYRLRHGSPILWLCGISTPSFLISAYAFRNVPTFFTILIITAIFPIGIACLTYGIFSYFIIIFPKKLQSEDSLQNKPPNTIPDPNLQAGIEPLIERRISDAVDRLRDFNQSDLKDLNLKHTKPWQIWSISATLFITAFGIISWLIAPDLLRKEIEDYIQKKFIDTPFRLAISKETDDYIKNELTPLKIKAKIQRYVSGSKAGRYDMYLELNKIASEKPEYPEYAEDIQTALNDVFFYFDAEMMNEGRTLGDPISVLPIQLSVDEAIRTYYLDKRDMQESAINTLAKLGSETCLYDLCESIEKQNLRVIVRIIRTLRILTGINFGTLDIDSVKTWWGKDTNKKKYKSCYKEYIEAITYMESKFPLNNKDIEHVIPLLDKTIELDPNALYARCQRALLLTLQGNTKAEEEFKKIEDHNSNYRWLFFYRAILFLNQGRKDDARKSLEKAIKISPSIEKIITEQPAFENLLPDLKLK